MGWIANLLVLIGTFLIGSKNRIAFIWIAFGEALWVYVGYSRSEWDIISICVVFTIMAVINFYRWGNDN